MRLTAKTCARSGAALWTAFWMALLLAACVAAPQTAPNPRFRIPYANSARPTRACSPTCSCPTGRARVPAVIVLGGYEGGIKGSDLIAESLARSGFAAFAVAYFGEPGLPATLADVPIEYFARAARLFATQPEIDRTHIAVFGTSRGSEAAALPAG